MRRCRSYIHVIISVGISYIVRFMRLDDRRAFRSRVRYTYHNTICNEHNADPLRLCKTLRSPHVLARGGMMCSLAHPSSRTTPVPPSVCTCPSTFEPHSARRAARHADALHGAATGCSRQGSRTATNKVLSIHERRTALAHLVDDLATPRPCPRVSSCDDHVHESSTSRSPARQSRSSCWLNHTVALKSRFWILASRPFERSHGRRGLPWPRARCVLDWMKLSARFLCVLGPDVR